MKLQEMTKKSEFYPHEADKFFVADSLVGFVGGGGTRGPSAVAVAGVSAAVVVSALVTEFELALARAAWTLRNTK